MLSTSPAGSSAITTVYHFLFVPVTIGLVVVRRRPADRLVPHGRGALAAADQFWGKLFLINFALGVVTGHRAGVPVRDDLERLLALRRRRLRRAAGDGGAAAFFLESTFLGLWIFGWDRLPEGAPGRRSGWSPSARLSALLHPRRQLLDAAPGRLPTQPGTQPRRADRRSGGADQLDRALRLPAHDHRGVHDRRACSWSGIAAWHLRASRTRTTTTSAPRRPRHRRSCVVLVARPSASLIGHLQGKLMTKQQPMKMAAAEALYDDQSGAPLLDLRLRRRRRSPSATFDDRASRAAFVPRDRLLNGNVQGINDLQAQYSASYGPGDYLPDLASPTGRSAS